MNLNTEFLEEEFIFYNLRTFLEINELNSAEKSELSISYFINLAFSEIKSKQPEFLFNEDKDLMGYTYFYIVRYYIAKKLTQNEKIYSAKDFADEFHKNNPEVGIREALGYKVDRFINDLNFTNITYNDKYLKSKKNRLGKFKGHIFSKRNINELTALLKKYDNKTFFSIRHNRLSKIKLKEYEYFVNILRNEIMNSDDEFKNIRLSVLERRFNFEHIKNMCNAINELNLVKQKIETIEKNIEIKKKKYNITYNYQETPKVFKRNVAKDLLYTMDIPDINNRFKYINSYVFLENPDEVEHWKYEIDILLNEAYPLFISYTIYLLENTYNTQDEIYDLIEKEKKIFKCIYLKDTTLDKDLNDMNNYITDYAKGNYCSPFELNKNFNEENFNAVMTELQKYNSLAINELYKEKKKAHMEKIRIQLIEDYKKDVPISESIKKYKEDDIDDCIAYFEDDTNEDLFAYFKYNEFKPVIEKIKQFKKNKNLSNKDARKNAENDIKEGSTDKEISEKYDKDIRTIRIWRLKLNVPKINYEN